MTATTFRLTSPDDELTTAEAAAYLDVRADALRQWRARGIGPRGRQVTARKVTYRRGDLEAWVRLQGRGGLR